MSKILLIFVALIVLNAKEYQAKIEPVNRYTLRAEAMGKITFLNNGDELKYKNGLLLKIDDSVDRKKLNNLKGKLSLLNEIIKIKEENYKNIIKLKSKSKTEKDNKKVEILNLKLNRLDLLNAILSTEDMINKKNIYLKNAYIKTLFVKMGEFVAVGNKLCTIEDHSRAKITIYADKEDIKNLQNKKIIINGKKWQITKVATSTDSKYISLYKVELISKDKVNNFGDIVSVKLGL